ncbi:MAG: hypothetical protein MZU95_12385 [Desulfomicrobium escambiense]|nr:hypothetical protein [Desulfomicrobium escambiense]
MAKINMVQAVNLALREEMERDGTVVLMGEDVGRDGGVFRTSDGLFDLFGPRRVIDTPLAESGIAGVAVGMAVCGLKPVAEIQFMGFIYPAIDQIFSHAREDPLPFPGQIHLSPRREDPLRRRHQGAGTPFREHRGPFLPHARHQGRHPVDSLPCQRPSHFRHQGPRSRHLPRADEGIPPLSRRRAGRRLCRPPWRGQDGAGGARDHRHRLGKHAPQDAWRPSKDSTATLST